MENELEAELKFHFDSLIESYVARGMTRGDAERRARIEAGIPALLKDQCRDERRISLWENLARDIFYSLRGMRANPGFVAAAAAAIALGIGANTALFSMVYTLMYRPLNVSDAGTFYNVHVETFGQGNRSTVGSQYNVSWAEFRFLREASRTATIAGLAEAEMTRKGDPRPVRAQLVSDNLLPLTGGRPVLGRFFEPKETISPGSTPVVVLSYHAWREWFAGDPAVAGKTIALNRQPFTVIGVAGQRTTGPVLLTPDVWIPLTMQAITRAGDPLIGSATTGWIQLFARPQPGQNKDAMQAELRLLAQQSLQPHLPQRQARASVEPGAYMNFPFVKRQSRPVLAILMLAVSLVLVVACANVANMLLARGLSRRREIAIRLSIGAGRKRLIQQLLTESVMLAMVGGAAGLLVAWGAARMLLLLIPVELTGRHQLNPSPDAAVLGFTAVISVLTGVVFGLLPALQALRFDLTPALKTEGLDGGGRSGPRRLQNALIGVQVAVCLILLVNAGLLLRGFTHALNMDPGQRTTQLLITSFDLRQQQYDADRSSRFLNTLRENLKGTPGVIGVTASMVEPLYDQCDREARVPAAGSSGRKLRISCDSVTPDYFSTTGIRLLRGREFTEAEMRNQAAVAIVDERFAREAFGSSDQAIGATIRLIDNADHQVVGVAAAVRPLDISGSGLPRVYQPLRGIESQQAKLVVLYAGSPGEMEKAIREAAAKVDPTVTAGTKRIEESIESVLIPSRLAASVAGGLGTLALILASTGVYGLVAFAISRRKREVGIRMALGASRGDVLRLVIWQGLKPVIAGSLAGLALAALASQALQAMLFGLSPLDPLAFVGTALLLTAMAAAAALLPAWSALRIDPAITLRVQ